MVALSLWKVVCCQNFCYFNGWQPCHLGRQSVLDIFLIPLDGSLVIMEGSLCPTFFLFQQMVALSIWKVVYCRDFCYPNGCSFVIIEGSMLSISLLFQWMIALSLCKVFCCSDFCYSNGWQPCDYGRQSMVDIFVIPIDGSLVIMEGSFLSRFLLLQWMVSLSLWKVVCCRYLCYSNGWQPCHY